MATDLDVLVAGGGIAGSVAALSLARKGFATALLDHRRAAPPGRDYLPRVSSINLHSQSVLAALGAWDDVADVRACAFERIETWDGGDDRVLTFEAAQAGLRCFGHVVENDLVRCAVQRRFLAMEGRVAVAPGGVESITAGARGVEVVTSAGETLRCALLVGADGADSAVRRLNGIRCDSFDYRQRALVCRVFPERSHRDAAYQKFMPSGPLAFLPLADGSCSIVWSMDDDVAETVLRLDDDAFCERLGAAFDHRLGGIRSCGERFAFALRRRHAARYVLPRVALIGDACHTLHPLAGLGANQGIADAEALSAQLTRRPGADRRSDFRNLRRYERRRRTQNGLTLMTMDLFHFGFANDNPLLKLARRNVFRAVDASPAVKNFFISRATDT